MRASPLVVFALSLMFLPACSGGPQRPAFDADADKKEWKEIAVQFPAYPRNENLVRFDAGGASAHRFYIDAPSLAIGGDGVVRYTLVTRTAGGATNVTFEGIRCDGRGHKRYAVGEANGTWTPARNPQWRRIQYQDTDTLRLVLMTEYLCEGRDPIRSEKDVLDRLRRGPARTQL